MTADGPWTADRELDAAGVARALREALPELPFEHVRLLGSGWDFDAFEVDARWVFRFPRRTQEQTRLAKELALLPWLGEQLDLPHPRYAWPALSAPSFPYTFSGYPKLEGRHASSLDPADADLEAIGAQLGAQMRRLHDLAPPPELRAALEEGYEYVTCRAARDGKERYVDAFAAHVGGALGRRAQAFLRDDARLPLDEVPTPCLLHDDLHGEHVLLDASDPAKVTGWLDWGDACLGDPAREFAPLFPWGGDRLLDAMLAAYGDDDPARKARARYHGLCLAFVDWHHWQRTGNDDALAWTTRLLDRLLR